MTQNAKLSFWSHFKALSELFPQLIKFCLYDIHIQSCNQMMLSSSILVLVFSLFQAISQNVILQHPTGFPRSHHIYLQKVYFQNFRSGPGSRKQVWSGSGSFLLVRVFY